MIPYGKFPQQWSWCKTAILHLIYFSYLFTGCMTVCTSFLCFFLSLLSSYDISASYTQLTSPTVAYTFHLRPEWGKCQTMYLFGWLDTLLLNGTEPSDAVTKCVQTCTPQLTTLATKLLALLDSFSLTLDQSQLLCRWKARLMEQHCCYINLFIPSIVHT